MQKAVSVTGWLLAALAAAGINGCETRGNVIVDGKVYMEKDGKYKAAVRRDQGMKGKNR